MKLANIIENGLHMICVALECLDGSLVETDILFFFFSFFSAGSLLIGTSRLSKGVF